MVTRTFPAVSSHVQPDHGPAVPRQRPGEAGGPDGYLASVEPRRDRDALPLGALRVVHSHVGTKHHLRVGGQ